jgi:glycogen debranching enzyme
VDATPLFVMLADAYFDRTGDHDVLKTLWPSIELALQWMDTFGDPDRDGFVEYARRTSRGLVHQGWKESSDAVMHADGSPAEGPVALCEVQGYVYAAKRGAARLASVLGETRRAEALSGEAQRLQKRFEQAFWREDLATYALALDGSKRPCLVRASNAGHCLYTGIARPDHAGLTSRTLLGEDFYSGWGIRTLASSEPRYNPMSYHNGSVWPHDNALIAAGLARYGFKDPVLRIFSGLFDAALVLDLHRLPELFCGFDRRPGEGPSLYPVACAPQSWSVATVFLLLQASLGLSIRGAEGRADFVSPCLPEFLDWVQIKNLRVGAATLDLSLERHAQDLVVRVLRREGQVEVSVTQ